MNRAHMLLLALTACGGAPFRVDAAPADDAGGDVLELDAGNVPDAIAAHVQGDDAPEDAPADVGPGPADAGARDAAEAGDPPRPDGSPEAAPDAPTFSPEAGPDAPADAGRPGAVCCNLGASCHSVAASCAIASNGTPDCYCGSARACGSADLGAYCYLINGCSGTVGWCPTGAE